MRARVLFAIGALAVALAARPAHADWEVRRTSDHALVEQAARALTARPEDSALAARLVRLAGKTGAPALRARFEARARGPGARYADLAASANVLLALGAYEDAAEEFTRAAAVRPALAVFTGRAVALARAGRLTDAFAAYEEALAHADTSGERRRLLEAELALVPPRDLEHELSLRRALAALTPRSEDAEARVVEVLERLGRPGEAADLLEGRGADARWFERGLRAADLRDAAGDGARAADGLATLLARLPPSDVERRRLAWAHALTVARHRDALPAFAEALARAPGPVEWNVLSQVRDELGDLEGALEAARRAAGARPGPELGHRIVALLERLGREDEAVVVYEDLARRAPEDPSWTLELIERELRRGRHQQAEGHFDRAVTRFARSPSAMIRLGELASRFGEDARARGAWERVRRLAPRDEQGILGLGETQFATGERELAVKTWRGLRERDPGLTGRLHLADVLLEHDLLAPALAEVEEARARAPAQPRVHRLLAQILERQRQTDAAVREWEAALALATGAAEAPLRHEARARILALLARTSRARLDERVRALEERVRLAPDDRETALFLAEAQQRIGNQAGAIVTLRALLGRDETASAAHATTDATAPTSPHDDAGATARASDDADVTFALVRLLRAAGQTEEAVRRLAELARRVPARAREAHVQIADVELARHDETVALAHAEEAARLGAGDGQALARIAAIQERAGDDERAFETYRRAFEGDADPTAGFALAALLERRGDATSSAEVLRHIVETATDDDVIFEAGRRALDIEELLGRLPDFEQHIARGLFSGARAPAMRRVLVEVLRRLLPTLYRASPGDATAHQTRARIAQHGLGPILGLLTEVDVPPEPAVIELLGMLGNKDAAPVLAMLAAPATDATGGSDHATPSPGAEDARLAAVIGLGRLGDDRGRDVLEKLVGAPDGRLRAAAVWALGRADGGRDMALFSRALRDARADVVGFACLGLGRARSPQAAGLLARVATDGARPVPVRRAAIAALGGSIDASATPTLLALARSGDDALARTALLALGARRDRRALPTLLEDALVGRPALGAAALRALELWASGSPPPDEARAIDGTRLELESLLAASEPPPSNADVTALWRDEPRLVAAPIFDALHGDTPQRRLAALAALDARDDGPGVGPLAAMGATPLTPATAAAVAAVSASTRDGIVMWLDDASPATRAAALRALAKAGDARVTPARVARAAIGRSEERAATLAIARRWAATSPGEARALAATLTSALAPSWTKATDSGRDEAWKTRLAIVDALAATGVPGTAGLESALGDTNALVRAAAAAALRPSSQTPPAPP